MSELQVEILNRGRQATWDVLGSKNDRSRFLVCIGSSDRRNIGVEMTRADLEGFAAVIKKALEA